MVNSDIVPILTKNNKSCRATQIWDYQAAAIKSFAGDWKDFFVNLRIETNKGFYSIIEQNKDLSYQNKRFVQSKSFFKRNERQENRKGKKSSKARESAILGIAWFY